MLGRMVGREVDGVFVDHLVFCASATFAEECRLEASRPPGMPCLVYGRWCWAPISCHKSFDTITVTNYAKCCDEGNLFYDVLLCATKKPIIISVRDEDYCGPRAAPW